MHNYQISSENMWHEIHDKFGDTGGVYLLKSIVNNTPTPINRLLKSDKDGVLYIGKANRFLDRVPELKKSISPQHTSISHECGSRYKANKNIYKHMPYESLYVQLIFSENPRKTESEYLGAYENEFGELPPLNRAT